MKITVNNVQAVNNQVIVHTIPNQETHYGKIVVSDLGKDKFKIAKVISVGPGIQVINPNHPDPIRIPLEFEVGDIVLIPEVSAIRLEELEDGEILSIKSDNIIAKHTGEDE